MSAIRKLFEIKKEKVEQENNSNIEDLEKNGIKLMKLSRDGLIEV